MAGNTERQTATVDQPLSESVVRALADAKDMEPDRIAECIYDAIDPDALDRLFEPVGEAKRQDAQLSFHVDRYEVVVQGGELIEVRPVDGATTRRE